MKACPFCAEDIQDAAIVCKHCGRELSAAAVSARTAVKPTKAAPKRKIGILGWVGIGFAALLLISLIQLSTSSPARQPAATTSSSAAAAIAQKPTLTPEQRFAADADSVKQIEQRLAENRQHLRKYYATSEQLIQSMGDEGTLTRIRTEYVKGKNDQKALSANASRLLPQVQDQTRRLYASSISEIFVKNGIDAKVAAAGGRLRISYALMSQPLVYKFQNEMHLPDQAKRAGFTSILYTNGFDSELGHEWTVDLQK